MLAVLWRTVASSSRNATRCLTAGTILQPAKLALTTCLTPFYLIGQAKSEISSFEPSRHLGVKYDTALLLHNKGDAHRYAHRIGASVFSLPCTVVMNLLRRRGYRSIRRGLYDLAHDIKETLIKTHPSLQGGLILIRETAAGDDSASLPL